jgi:hypothetical protein
MSNHRAQGVEVRHDLAGGRDSVAQAPGAAEVGARGHRSSADLRLDRLGPTMAMAEMIGSVNSGTDTLNARRRLT